MKGVKVDFGAKTATVDLSSADATAEKLIGALDKAGYKGKVKE